MTQEQKVARRNARREARQPKTRKITACGKTSRIPFHLSTFMQDHGGGQEEAKRNFIALINSCPMNAEKISKALNEHPDTYGRYEPYRFFNNENQIVIKETDCWGNEHLIYITEA